MRFKKEIRKVGNSYMVTIPKAFIDNETLVLYKKYDIEIHEKRISKNGVIDEKK